MKFKLQAGREIDVLTKDELKAGLTDNTASWFKEEARGFNTARFGPIVGTVSGAAVAIPGPGDPTIGPDPGFVWAVQRITADGLSANDVINVYRNSLTTRVGEITQARGIRRSDGILLRSNERLLFTGAALTATGDVSLNGDAIEVSEADIYKVL